MIEPSEIGDYVGQKRRIAGAVRAPDSAFSPMPDHLSEGLAQEFPVDGESWTYSPVRGGFDFAAPDGARRVFVADDPMRDQAFTARELLGWLRGHPRHANINQIALDAWLQLAAMAGVVEQAPGLPGHWRLRESAPR